MADSGQLLVESIVRSWNSTGKDEALLLFRKACVKRPLSWSNTSEFCVLLHELLACTVSGDLEPDDVAAFLSDLVSELGIDVVFPSVLTDCLTVLDAEVGCSDSKEQRTAFKNLLSACSELIGDALLKERLDMETLEVVGLVPSKTTFNQKYVKTKTKLFYKQQKFNLFREENEGYSKLISELSHEPRPVTAVPAVLDNIKSLIGRFSLDPNRVLDVILEAFESRLEKEGAGFFVALLRGYASERSTFVNILGFRFQSYQHLELSKSQATPASLYRLAALLLHHEDLVTLNDLYPHLSVGDSKLREFREGVMEDATVRARKANVVSLTEKTDEERDKEAEIEKEKKELSELLLSLETNQKLGLCHALLEMGDWGGASALLKLLPPTLPSWSPAITQAFCRLVSLAIEPLYRSYCPKAAKGLPRPPAPPPSSRRLKPCSGFDDLTPHVFEMLYQLGPHVHTQPVLLVKIVRLGRAFFKERAAMRNSGELPSQERERVYEGFVSVLNEVVLPSLSLLPCNCGVAEEVWSMVKQLPYEIRYQLYGCWKNSSYGQHPELIEARSQTNARGRYIMKRLTKDNIKPSGRQIGKLSHSNPGIIFDYVLSQIQRYDNFIIPVVDSLKYLTPLAYDALAYCIIEALGNPQKERLKHEDTNISDWLKGLASFCGNVFKKYPIELTGLLQYIANQLKAGKSFDLLVLKEVVQKMAGIDISEELTAPQLEALAGGELLKAEGASFLQVRNTKKSSQRLREALVDAHLGLPLFLLMAQQRDGIVFRDGALRHLKLVGNLFDNCLDTLVQFGGFLATHLSVEEYSARVPKLNELVLHYHIPADISFFMLRPITSSTISKQFLEAEKASKASSEKQDKKSKSLRQEVSYLAACQAVLEPLAETARLLHPARVWEDVSVRLYTTFWSLSLYDLYTPTGRYDDEINKAKQAIREIENNPDMTSSKKKKEQERSSVLMEKLAEERQRQEDSHRLVRAWLRQEKDAWFNAKVTKNRTITQFLQLCVFPRCCFTASDAIFCAKFVCMLHAMQTPNFSTLLFFDRVFSDISYTVVSCTENEVRRYGRFLGSLLETVSRWHSSEAVYAQECAKTPGFISMMRTSGAGNEKQYLDYENYRHITFKWHFKLTKSLVILLESTDYMQVRNGLIVMTKVLPYYPKVYHLSIALEKRIEKIMEEEKEKRQDLYALAMGYAGMLKVSKSGLVPESDFHNREEKMKAMKQSEVESSKVSSGRPPTTTTTSSSSQQQPQPPQQHERDGGGGGGGEKGKPASSSSAAVEGEGNTLTPPTAVAAAAAASSGRSSAASKTRTTDDTTGHREIKTEKTDRRSTGSGGGGGGGGGGTSRSSERSSKERVEPSSSARNSEERERGSERRSLGGKSSKNTLNGPTSAPGGGGGVSPGRAGQRRQNGSPELGAEREAKRRKLDESAKSTGRGETDNRDPPSSSTAAATAAARKDDSAERREKTIRPERKRERSLEGEGSELKRRKESPDVGTAKDVVVKEKKRVVRVSKKDSRTELTDASPVLSRKVGAPVKLKEDDKIKKHKVRPVRK